MQKILICLFPILLLAGCAHKIDIQQGNPVSLESLDKVQVGMDREQVRYLLGTPLLADPFHQDRWDYYYSMQKGGKVVERYGATLYFSNNQLARMERFGPLPAKASIPEMPKGR